MNVNLAKKKMYFTKDVSDYIIFLFNRFTKGHLDRYCIMNQKRNHLRNSTMKHLMILIQGFNTEVKDLLILKFIRNILVKVGLKKEDHIHHHQGKG